MRYLPVALLFLASTAVAQNWQPVVSLDSHGGVLLVDVSDITEVKGYRRAWFKWAYGTDQPVTSEYRESVPKAKTYRWVRSAHLFHCTQQTTALAEQRWFNSKDQQLGIRRPEALQFRPLSPGSTDQPMLDAVCRPESVRSLERREEQAQMTHAPNPKAYYPMAAFGRGEQGSATVKACVDSSGKLLREPVVTVSSGFPALDGAAIEVAKDARYLPGVREGVALPESCLEVPVAFRQAGNNPEFDAEAKLAKPVNPDNYYPSDARARGEQGSALVQTCVGRNGNLLRDPEIAESSGFPDLDAAAIEVAEAAKYTAGSAGGVRLPESCIRFRVNFPGKLTR